jgi:nicotinamidase-related amidase
MRTMQASKSLLLVVDVQARLMPAIDAADAVISNVKRLIATARMLDVPIIHTEQNPKGLGHTVADLALDESESFQKMTFDTVKTADFLDQLPRDADLIVCGCEAHVCVLQTALGLIDANREVFIVADAIGSRRAESKQIALQRLDRHGADIVTTEMVVFEWLESAEHPRFRETVAIIK